MPPRTDPGLLRFVLARLDDEEEEMVLLNTPVPDSDHVDRRFHDLFLDRGALLEQARRDRDVVLACAGAMAAEDPGPAPVPLESSPHPVALLGSQVIKLIASRYRQHPDYDPAWLLQ